jgi:gp16 family phage-associated protein
MTELRKFRQAATLELPKARSEQPIESFLARGESVKAWAKAHGFHPELVYTVLRGQRKFLRGKSFQIAQELGMK